MSPKEARMLRKRIAWGLMTLASLYILYTVSSYLTLDPEVFFPEQRATYLAHLGVLFTHVAGAMVALAIGPFMFLSRLRVHWPAVHRWLGRMYLLGVLAGGVAGLALAPYAYTGAPTSAGFAMLGLLWLGTGLMAFVRIREGDVQAHRRWMLRNFALTLAGVSLRLQALPLAMLFGFDLGYMIVAWSCWVPNILVAEWMLRRRQSAPPPVAVQRQVV
jgi:uncharacterized membrane protein